MANAANLSGDIEYLQGEGGVRFDQAGIDCEAIAGDQPFRQSTADALLEDVTQQVAVARSPRNAASRVLICDG
jgi:hypothetical protein